MTAGATTLGALAAAIGPRALARVFAQARSEGVFRHGVASGDPLRDRVVLWTRVTPGAPDAIVDVSWMIARDARMSRVVAQGSARTSAQRDYTVKIDAAALQPGATYYYRFASRGAQSPIGRTRTLPGHKTTRVRLAVASCANLPFGYFNVYRRIAARPDLDAVVHLGDYFYEYGNDHYGNRPGGDGRALGRVPYPDREIVTLDDYRARYAQYREDPDLQAAHQQHPFIVVWDDHETANNSWSEGAENHNPGEGDWATRRAAALRAWREWMPVREPVRGEFRMYRQFPFGDLADVLMLDTRIEGRDQQVNRQDVAALGRGARQLLGEAQEEWLLEGLRDSTAARKPWQILGQQVMFAPQSAPGAPAASNDSWEGYRAARTRVFEAASAAGVTHLVVLTGDVHSSWAYDLSPDPFNRRTYDPASGRGAVGTEIITPAVTSPGGPTPELAARLLSARPHLKYVHGDGQRGYVVVDFTPERLHADWWYVPTIAERTSEELFGKGMVSDAAAPGLVDAGGPSAPRSAPDLASCRVATLTWLRRRPRACAGAARRTAGPCRGCRTCSCCTSGASRCGCGPRTPRSRHQTRTHGHAGGPGRSAGRPPIG
ncbi:MAG: alkaline phosphatase D family protein [Acidobacteriota bacterium]